jgi:glycosyltransferase involved in cell wall biosynthesis
MLEVKGLVSIIIPFCNSERFLTETIECVLSQTYPHWELFLVDDGSSDGGIGIARSYEARFPDKIHYLEHAEHRNYGLTCSRNHGARNSHGEFLASLDSDDIWLPHKLEEQVSIMASHPEAGLVYGHSEYWYDWEGNENEKQDNLVPPLAPGGKMYFPTYLLTNSYPLGPLGAPCPSSFLIRRSAFDCVAGFEECFNPKTHQVYEDSAFLTKIYLNVPVFVGESCWERYRCRPTSMSHSIGGTSREESARRYFFNWLREYLRQNHVTDPIIWKAIRKEAWMYLLPLPPSILLLLRRINNRLSR